MFNSPVRLAATAAGIGAIANTLRLEMVDMTAIPPAGAAIVIMVPGMYLYRVFYNLGIMSLGPAASWFASAILIIAALPLGLIFARILTDETFRYCT